MSEHLNRRRFLAALSATGASVVVACTDDSKKSATASNDSTTSPSTSTKGPKKVVSIAAPTAGLVATPFTLGVASGDPTSSAVILWTRLATNTEAADGFGGLEKDVDIKWEVASDEGFETLVGTGIVTASKKFAHSIHLDATGLAADTWYWYRFAVDDYVSAVGRARTLPSEDAEPDELRLGFASCQDYTEGYYPAHRAMTADKLDLVFFLGDFIYEYPSSPQSARQVLGGICKTQADYVLRYSTYLTDKDLQSSRASCPWVVTWDDHEVENNYANLANADAVTDKDFAERRAAAYLAYYIHMPLRLDPPDSADWRIYRGLKFGSLAEFFVLDGRQYRDDQACNSRSDAIVSKSACPELDDADRSMLGSEQETWLSDGLKESSTTWKVLAQQTVMFALVLGDLVLNVDQWDGYPAARERLFKFIADNKISDVVVLTGDIHSAAAGNLAPASTDGKRVPVAVEFVGTSITSGSLVDVVPGGAEIVTVDKFPGVAYINVRDHGYGRCTVTPTKWTTEFVVVESIEKADSKARVDATCVTEVGKPVVTRL